MKNTTWLGACLLLLLVAASPGWATDTLESHPGYFPIDSVGLFAGGDTEVEIDLKGPMIKLVVGATEHDDPELARALAGLQAIRVLVGEPGGLDLPAVMAQVDAAGDTLEAQGWHRIVKVREDDERVHIFARELDGQIEGLTVLAVEGLDEVALINIVGRLDPASLGDLLDGLDVVDDIDLEVD